MTRNASPAGDHRHLVLPSDLSLLEQVADEAEAFVTAQVEDEDFVFQVVLVTTEAVTNAMEHGNGLDPAKKVKLDLFARADGIEVSVEDEGSGFDPEAIRDPLAEENLMHEGGRGVYLIEQIANEVHFDLGGRRIRMLLHWPDGDGGQA